MPSAYDYVGQSTQFTGGTVNGGGVLTGINDSISNFFTGDRDYARQLESMGMQNAFNAVEAEKARKFNAEEAQKSRDWQEMMSNSAYSRSIADLKKNGINPYAVLTGMGAASTPSGATAGGSSAHSSSGVSSRGGNGIATLVNSAFALAGTVLGISAKKEIAMLDSMTRYGTALIGSQDTYYDKYGNYGGTIYRRKF